MAHTVGDDQKKVELFTFFFVFIFIKENDLQTEHNRKKKGRLKEK